MKNVLTLICLAGIVAFGCGFTETSRIIKIKKDGSGVILVRKLVNPTTVEEGAKIHDPEKLKKVVYGKGVQYIVSTECKGKNGWVGYLAKYKFTDINELRIFPASLPRAASVGPDDDLYKSGWRFATGDGKEKAAEGVAPAPVEGEKKEVKEGEDVVEESFILQIIPLFTDFPDEGDDGVAGEEKVAAGDEDLEMKNLQKGRRYVTYIQLDAAIDPELTTVPAGYFSKGKANTFVLNDEQFDVMWSKPAARQRISQEEPDFGSYIGADQTKGYKTISKRIKVTLK